MPIWWWSPRGGGASPSPPASPLLAVTDNADGSGGVATIVGSTAGSTNTVMACLVDATGLRSPVFVTVGSRTGDGTVAVAPTFIPGYYWWIVTSTTVGGQAVSSPVYQALTESSTAVAQRCMDAIVARLNGLTMKTLSSVPTTAPNSFIYQQLLFNDKVKNSPCILVGLDDSQESQPGTTTARDDVGYYFRCTVLDRCDTDDITRKPTYLLWRQQIFRAFRNQRLGGVPEIITVKVEPSRVIDPQLPAYAIVASALGIRCISREVRG